jgi:hypothetical protein
MNPEQFEELQSSEVVRKRHGSGRTRNARQLNAMSTNLAEATPPNRLRGSTVGVCVDRFA